MENGSLIFTERNKTLIAALCCEIDHHTAKGLRERIDSRLFLTKPDTLVLDFSGVPFMDSSGIALIIGRAEAARSLSCGVHLVGLTERVRRLLSLSGIDKLENLTAESN